VGGEAPKIFQLLQNFPNPFNPSTEIRYSLSKDSPVSIKVYDVLGREIVTLTNSSHKSGSYKLDFMPENISSGVYFYSLITPEFRKTMKMIYQN